MCIFQSTSGIRQANLLHFMRFAYLCNKMVFVSYAKRDWVDEAGRPRPDSPVSQVLDALTAAGIPYWIDRERLEGGDTYPERIARNIKACDIFLFLSSAAANSSPWTRREIGAAVNYGKPIIPLRLDHSGYDDAVALYLSPVQYIDWIELGPETALQRMVARIQHPGVDESTGIEFGRLPKLTSLTLYAAVIVLTGFYALLTYLFLWARTLQKSEMVGGLIGYVGEFALLMSIYYVIRMLRLRRCRFILPILVIGAVLCAAFVSARIELFVCDILLMIGWLGIWLSCLYHTPDRPSFFRQMSKEEVLMKINDPENLLLVYLTVKCLLVVIGHFAGHFLDMGQIFTRFTY